MAVRVNDRSSKVRAAETKLPNKNPETTRKITKLPRKSGADELEANVVGLIVQKHFQAPPDSLGGIRDRGGGGSRPGAAANPRAPARSPG